MRLGAEMGDAFGRGLVASSHGKLDGVSVRVPLAGHLPTSTSALGAALRAADHVKDAHVTGFAIPIERMRRDDTLDLSGYKVSDADLMVIAGCLRAVGSEPLPLRSLKVAPKHVKGDGVAALAAASSLTCLDLSGKMSEVKMRTMGQALLANGSGRSRLALKFDAFDMPVGVNTLDLSRRNMGDDATTLLAGALRLNGVVTSLE